MQYVQTYYNLHVNHMSLHSQPLYKAYQQNQTAVKKTMYIHN